MADVDLLERRWNFWGQKEAHAWFFTPPPNHPKTTKSHTINHQNVRYKRNMHNIMKKTAGLSIRWAVQQNHKSESGTDYSMNIFIFAFYSSVPSCFKLITVYYLQDFIFVRGKINIFSVTETEQVSLRAFGVLCISDPFCLKFFVTANWIVWVYCCVWNVFFP